jgi:DNA-damage-inducible protein J
MAQTALTVRMDNQVKAQFDKLCNEFGMSANTAINIFVKAVIRSRSIPFSINDNSSDMIRQRAIELFMLQRSEAEAGKTPDISLEEINDEISASRLERQAKIQ